jgi:hypothetical protein
MTWLIGLLTSRLAGPVASIAAVILLGLAVSHCARADRAEHALDLAANALALSEKSLATCRTNTDTLKVTLARQNAAVDALKAEGAARVAQSEKATQAARAVAESYRRRSRDVLAAEPRTGDLCAAAGDLIERHVK